jgi:hypothetical protein
MKSLCSCNPKTNNYTHSKCKLHFELLLNLHDILGAHRIMISEVYENAGNDMWLACAPQSI